jgi:hypothetical protein
MKILVLLVSAQAAANLLPALDRGLKPETAVLFVTKAMKQRARDLAAVLNEVSVKTREVELKDEHDFEHMQADFQAFADSMAGQEVAVNLTGGTKLMALAAYTVAKAYHWQALYLDLDTDEVIQLETGALKSQRRAIEQNLRLSHYLRGYGFRVESPRRPQEQTRHRDLLRGLILGIEGLGPALGAVNLLAAKAKDSLEASTAFVQPQPQKLESLLDDFHRAGVLHREGAAIRFVSEDDRLFANGGWLELHVYQTLAAVQGQIGIRDKAVNLQLVDGNGVRNELDVAFLSRNHLFVIECKTARMSGEGGADKANESLFKLAELARRVGGIGTRSMLVSYRPVKPAERQLAEALHVEVVAVTELARLGERLKRWCA